MKFVRHFIAVILADFRRNNQKSGQKSWLLDEEYTSPCLTLISDYVGPNERRRNALNKAKQNSYQNKVAAREHKEALKAEVGEAPKHVTEEIFVNNWKTTKLLNCSYF